MMVVFLLGSGFLVYLGLTRTEVGRDYLRQELESGFAEAFNGEVTIKTVSGNIRSQVHLQDIAFYDARDSLWLHIDEITVQPNWKSLFGLRFELNTLSVEHPSLFIRYQADSLWNLASVLTPRQSTRTASSTWEFKSTHISVSGGSISISYQESIPEWVESGRLFDLAAADISDISLEGDLNLQPDRQLFAIQSLQANIDTLKFAADGELLLEHDLLHINALNLSSSTNHATVVGVLSNRKKLADISLTKSHLTPEFVHAISPDLLLPTSLTLSGQANRQDGQWSLENYIIASDDSRVEISSAKFESNEKQISFEASIAPSTLDPADLQTILNNPFWNGGDLQIEGLIEGQRTSEELTLSATLDIVTEAGGRVKLEASSLHNQGWSYDANLSATGINLGEFPGAETLAGIANGTLSLSGEGVRSPSISTKLALSPSVIGGRSLDSLWMEGTLTEQKLNLIGFLNEQESRLETGISANWAGESLSFEASGSLAMFDLGALFVLPELETNIHANWKLHGIGNNLDDLSAFIEIQTDSSTVIWKNHQRTAPPTRWSIALTDTVSLGPRLIVQSNVLDLEMSGKFSQSSLRQTVSAWSDAFSETFDRFGDHLRIDRPTTDIDSVSTNLYENTLTESSLTESVQSIPMELNLNWKLHDHPATDVLLPMIPTFSSNNQGNAMILFDGGVLHLETQIQDETFMINQIAAYQAAIRLTLDANLDQEIESSWKVDLSLAADSVTSGRVLIQTPRISVNQDGKAGNLNIYTNSADLSIGGHLSSTIELLSDRVRLRIQEAHIPTGDVVWAISEPANIDLFADATVITPFSLETGNPFLDEMQIVTVQGNLSNLPSDTLRLSLNGVDLAHLSNILELRRPLGGQIDADLLWTGLWQPEITGGLEVDTLTFDNKLVGHLQASSILLPGGSDLGLAMIIDSIGVAPAGYQYTINDISLIGNIPVPTSENPGVLDIMMDVRRLDSDFLQLLLRDFSGFKGGLNGHITLGGTPANLILGGSLSWDSGGFEIPRFNSSYETTASVTLQGDKIFVTELLVQDSDGGMAQIEGILNLNDFRFLSLDASGSFETLQIMNVLSHTSNLPFYGDIRVSGDATLTGPLHTSFLRSDNLVVSPQSEIFIPVRESDALHDPGFIIYVDSTQSVERQLTSFRQRENILGARPAGERLFRDGLDMDLNLLGPPGSNIHLVIDPLLGDVIDGTGTARVQIQRTGGDMATYGSFELSSGDYLFTAGEVFVRRFLIDSGTITWNGEPLNPTLDIQGAYRTRASRNGLPEDVGGAIQTSLPLIVNLDVSGTLNTVQIDLALEIDQRQEVISDTPLLDSYLNRPDLATEHATSVLLTNSFLLSANGTRGGILTSSAVNSVSSLVASQLNRYLSQVIPQADFSLGVQSDETVQDMDVSAGIALRLLNERLVIRGQGVYRGLNTEEIASQGLEGEFIVEIRLSPSVAVEFFYRRESDVLSESLITQETGLGLNYRAEFTSWKRLFRR